MRILFEGNVHEIKAFFISESKAGISVEWVDNDAKPDKVLTLSISKDHFKHGAKEISAFIEKVRRDMLEKGFFDFDQDYSKMNLK